jgi:hypothetical protein
VQDEVAAVVEPQSIGPVERQSDHTGVDPGRDDEVVLEPAPRVAVVHEVDAGVDASRPHARKCRRVRQPPGGITAAEEVAPSRSAPRTGSRRGPARGTSPEDRSGRRWARSSRAARAAVGSHRTRSRETPGQGLPEIRASPAGGGRRLPQCGAGSQGLPRREPSQSRPRRGRPGATRSATSRADRNPPRPATRAAASPAPADPPGRAASRTSRSGPASARRSH